MTMTLNGLLIVSISFRFVRFWFKANFLPEVAAEAIISVIRGLTMTCAGRPELMRRPLYQVLAWLEGGNAHGE
jgi:hypothetical protein